MPLASRPAPKHSDPMWLFIARHSPFPNSPPDPAPPPCCRASLIWAPEFTSTPPPRKLPARGSWPSPLPAGWVGAAGRGQSRGGRLLRARLLAEQCVFIDFVNKESYNMNLQSASREHPLSFLWMGWRLGRGCWEGGDQAGVALGAGREGRQERALQLLAHTGHPFSAPFQFPCSYRGSLG